MTSIDNVVNSTAKLCTLNKITSRLNERIYVGLKTIGGGFGKLHVAFLVWIFLHVLTIGLYYALQTWDHVFKIFKSRMSPVLQNVWSFGGILGFCVLQISFLYVSTKACVVYNLPFGTASALLIETFRLIMKTHAFVRTNVPRLTADERLTPMLSYLYYLFAPTFIYRDSYPRTDKIRWKIVFKNLLEILAIIFLLSFMYECFIQPSFYNIRLEALTLGEISKKYFGMMLPSNLIFLSGNYLVIHSWLNFTGELMRFGDRLYYKDWWTSRDYKTYYRSWNITVHEWFYEFIYKDFKEYIFNGSEVGSSIMVFYISTIMHEYVLVFSLRMFFPLLSILYGAFGVFFYFTTSRLPHRVGNIFVWLTFLIGSTIIVTFYAMAYYSGKYSF